MRNRYKIVVRISEGRRPIGRHRHRWDDNIEMDFKVIGNNVVDWILQVHDRTN
jgi:hypothetical protein